MMKSAPSALHDLAAIQGPIESRRFAKHFIPYVSEKEVTSMNIVEPANVWKEANKSETGYSHCTEQDTVRRSNLPPSV